MLPPPDATGTDVDSVTSLLQYHFAQSSAQEAHLSSELKSHRRTSQKSEAALRANIAALQKTLEKSSVADLRARQKALALGESVKRLTNGKEEVEAERERIELQVGDDGAQRDAGLEEAEKIRRKEWDLLKVEAAAVEEERDLFVGENDKTVAGWESELNGLLARLDKVRRSRLPMHALFRELNRPACLFLHSSTSSTTDLRPRWSLSTIAWRPSRGRRPRSRAELIRPSGKLPSPTAPSPRRPNEATSVTHFEGDRRLYPEEVRSEDSTTSADLTDRCLLILPQEITRSRPLPPRLSRYLLPPSVPTPNKQDLTTTIARARPLPSKSLTRRQARDPVPRTLLQAPTLSRTLTRPSLRPTATRSHRNLRPSLRCRPRQSLNLPRPLPLSLRPAPTRPPPSRRDSRCSRPVDRATHPSRQRRPCRPLRSRTLKSDSRMGSRIPRPSTPLPTTSHTPDLSITLRHLTKGRLMRARGRPPCLYLCRPR